MPYRLALTLLEHDFRLRGIFGLDDRAIAPAVTGSGLWGEFGVFGFDDRFFWGDFGGSLWELVLEVLGLVSGVSLRLDYGVRGSSLYAHLGLSE